MHPRKIHCEAGIPGPPALGMIARNIGNILNRRAETGGTNHRTICASQTTFRNLIPARVFEIVQKQLWQAIRIQFPTHVLRGSRNHLIGLA
jgi:hypothetical protein